MEEINDKHNNPKLPIKLNKLKNIQIREAIKTETSKMTDKNITTSPIKTDSLIIIPTIIDNINNNNYSKNVEKPKRKGVLHKYINSSYFKESLGSIPNKSEKILLDKKKTLDRFSGSNSFFNQMNDNAPGVGSYDLNYDWNLKCKSVKMLSEGKRFEDFYNFLPGVGQYDLDLGKRIQQKKDNLRYRSLYSKEKENVNNNIYKSFNRNLYCYDPKNLNDIMKKKKNFNFCSYSGRCDYRGSKIPTPFDKIDDLPGPGHYFVNSNDNLNNKNDYYNIRKNAILAKSKKMKVKDILNKKYFSEINGNEDQPSFHLKQNGNKKENKVYNLEDIYKLYKNNNKGVVNENTELKKILENEKPSSKKLYFKIIENMELNKIKTILGNDNGKPDFFYLSPERWKKDKKAYKAPGPAYYFY